MFDQEHLRKAKLALKNRLKGRARLAGIGIMREGEEYAIRVNLIDDGGIDIPSSQDGVRVLVRRVEAPKAR